MLPKNLKYGSKVESAPSRSYRSNIAPQNGTGNYALNDNIIINIPTRNNLVLVPSESYLKFTCKFTNGSTGVNVLRWDSCGAHGLIQRIRIYHGSNLLQDIDNYNLLAKILFDLQVPTDSAYGKYNILAGTRNDLITTLPDIGAGGAYSQADMQALDLAKCAVSQINSGEAISGGLAASASVSTTYCLNLISLVGTLCSQNYLPLFACTSAPLRVEIQLVDSCNKAMAASQTDATVALSNVEYVGNFIELSDNAMGMIYSSLGGAPLQFVVPDYRNYQTTYSLTASETQVNFSIPAKFSSLKSIICTCRDKGTGASTYFPFSSVKLSMSSYYFRVGSQIMPSKAPTTVQEYFCEVLKAIGSMSDLNHQPSIEKVSYSMDTSVANDAFGSVNSGSFYVGLDLENYSNASKESIFAGYNSNTDDIYAVMTFAGQTAVSVRFDAFAMFDEVVVFENNTAYVKF